MDHNDLNHIPLQPSHLEFSQEDNGKRLSIKMGGEILIRLRTMPATGYTWLTVALDANRLMETRTDKTLGQLLGGPGELLINLKAIAPGSTRLLLHYCRPWEKDIPPLDIFELNINIES